MSLIDNLEKIHEQLIEEEGIKVSQLPNDIKRKIKGWNLLYSRLKKNPDDSKLFRSLQKQSVELGDKIQDFIETDFDDSDGDGDGDGEPAQIKEPKPSTQDEPAQIKEPKPSTQDEPTQIKEPKPSTVKKTFGNLMMEKKILTSLKNNSGKISISELKQIISKEPTYPEQVVHNIKLRKIFLSSSYRKI